MTIIKICGITSTEDANLAGQAGGDYLGLIFAPQSPRAISKEQAAEIIAKYTGPKVTWVGVFQNQPLEEILGVLKAVPLNLIQLHGNESPELCKAIPLPVIKVFETSQNPTLDNWKPYFKVSKYLMIDKPKTKPKSDYHRQTLEWIASNVSQLPPVFVAGGLTANNVESVVATCHPYAVDVTSGVEQSPGVKDPAKLSAFCDTVKHKQRGSKS